MRAHQEELAAWMGKRETVASVAEKGGFLCLYTFSSVTSLASRSY